MLQNAPVKVVLKDICVPLATALRLWLSRVDQIGKVILSVKANRLVEVLLVEALD